MAESLTGASLVIMSDKSTPHPRSTELLAAGVPAEYHSLLGHHGVGTLVEKMGIVFTHMSVESMVATMPVEGNTQVTGLLHGGAHVVLAETLGSFAAAFHAGPGAKVVGIEINATHHRGASGGLVTGTATPLHLGRTLATHEVVMTDEAGRRLSTCRITNMILAD
ncbi:thioesterase family protein [Arthrobacter sp. PAMC 25486]|nr:thioesterase family protein [Arthrobacter sp. PAMC 25486]